MLKLNTALLRLPLLLALGECQLPKKRDGLPVPVQHKHMVSVHDRIITAADGLPSKSGTVKSMEQQFSSKATLSEDGLAEADNTSWLYTQIVFHVYMPHPS